VLCLRLVAIYLLIEIKWSVLADTLEAGCCEMQTTGKRVILMSL